MFDLVKFELKKIIARPSTRYTCLAVVLALCAIMTLNVLQTKTTSNTEEIRAASTLSIKGRRPPRSMRVC